MNPNASLLFSINGERSRQISVTGTDLTKAQKKVEFGQGATEQSLKAGSK